MKCLTDKSLVYVGKEQVKNITEILWEEGREVVLLPVVNNNINLEIM